MTEPTAAQWRSVADLMRTKAVEFDHLADLAEDAERRERYVVDLRDAIVDLRSALIAAGWTAPGPGRES
jgi:hypothetical protein